MTDILTLRAKMYECSEDLLLAMCEEDWEAVRVVVRVLFHQSRLGSFIAPFYDNIPQFFALAEATN